jgi:hypothetical protein
MAKGRGWLWAVVGGLLIAGCGATGGFIPAGAQPAGVFRGGLVGNAFEGPIVIHLYQTSGAGLLFTGRFTTANGDYHFRGTVAAGEIQGKISLGLGAITGRLSPDGRRMEGVFRLAQNHGSWSAVRAD